jgi:hypothetical protein
LQNVKRHRSRWAGWSKEEIDELRRVRDRLIDLT